MYEPNLTLFSVSHFFLFGEGERRWCVGKKIKLWLQVMIGMLRICEFLCFSAALHFGVCPAYFFVFDCFVTGTLNLYLSDLMRV